MEPFSSCVAVGLDVVQDEDGLHDRGGAARTTAQLDQGFPGLEAGVDPHAVDRWTWLIIAAYTQLRLARPSPLTCAAPLGAAGPTRTAHPGPRPPRISAPPRDERLSRRRTETHPARTRPGTRTTQPLPRPPPRRPHRHQQRSREDDPRKRRNRSIPGHAAQVKDQVRTPSELPHQPHAARVARRRCARRGRQRACR